MNEMSKSSYVYNVQLLIEDEHHASALAQLLNKLNAANFIDYKILSGIELGQELDARIANAGSKATIPIQQQDKNGKAASSPTKSTATNDSDKKKDSKEDSYSHSLDIFHQFKSKNKLIRLIVNRGLGIKSSIPCRVINVSEQESIITVYHVDEKQVYTFRLNEIEDYIES